MSIGIQVYLSAQSPSSPWEKKNREMVEKSGFFAQTFVNMILMKNATGCHLPPPCDRCSDAGAIFFDLFLSVIFLRLQDRHVMQNALNATMFPRKIQTGQPMNKSDLVKKLAQDCKMTKSAAEQALNSMIGTITNAVATGDKVALVGFGTFSVTERAAREGRNPQTGAVIPIAAGKAVKFKAGKTLSDAVK